MTAKQAYSHIRAVTVVKTRVKQRFYHSNSKAIDPCWYLPTLYLGVKLSTDIGYCVSPQPEPPLQN